MATLFTFTTFPVLETRRFYLRQLRDEDAPAIFAHMSDPEVMRFFGREPMLDLCFAEDWIYRYEVAFRESRAIRWAITRKEDGRLVGTIGYHNWLKAHLRAEVGYELGRAWWGQGIMTEVVQQVVAFGFEEMGLNRIEAVVIPQNPASRRVLEKAGFTVEALLSEYMVSDGQIWDAHILRLLRREYPVR